MQFTTFVSITAAALLASLPSTIVATDPYPTNPPSNTPDCQTITTTIDPDNNTCGPTPTCTTLACLEIVPITQRCGCSSIPTTSICPSTCPTSCGSTSYITAIEDCFPTYTPPPPGSTGYHNTTTKTDTITITTCPASKICTGQTVTYTSTEVCPTATCVCVYPSVTYTTTTLPGETNPPEPVPTPSVSTSPTPSPSASPTLIEANVAAGRWAVSAGVGILGGFMIAVLGLL